MFVLIIKAYNRQHGHGSADPRCKGDRQSQPWPSQLRNSLTDFDKIWQRWLHWRRDPICQIWSCMFSVYGRVFRVGELKNAI